jgi:hypothetical protein
MKLGYFHFWDRKVKNCADVFSEIKDETDLISFAKKTGDCKCGHECHSKTLGVMIKMTMIEMFFFTKIKEHLENNGMSSEDPEKQAILDVYKTHGDTGLMTILTRNKTSYNYLAFEIEEIRPFLFKYNFLSSHHVRKKYFGEACSKISDLVKNHPDFWKVMGKNIWKYFSLGVIDTIRDYNHPIDAIQMIAEEYGFIGYTGLIEIYKDNFRIGLMSDVELSDCLGLPFVPESKTNLHNRVLEAIENPQKISEKVKRWNDRQLEFFIEGVQDSLGVNPEVKNTENLIGDPINEYPPDQIFRCFTSNGKIYQFTLEEIRNIWEKPVNPYTRHYIDVYESFSNIRKRPTGHKTGTVTYMLKSIIEPDPLH